MTGTRDPDDQFAPSEGPTPSDDDADRDGSLEEYISGMDHTLGVDDHTTAAEQRAGDTIDSRTRREQPQNARPRLHMDLTNGDDDVEATDDEPALVADEVESFGDEAPELSAMHLVDEAPGATDHPDDYVEE